MCSARVVKQWGRITLNQCFQKQPQFSVSSLSVARNQILQQKLWNIPYPLHSFLASIKGLKDTKHAVGKGRIYRNREQIQTRNGYNRERSRKALQDGWVEREGRSLMKQNYLHAFFFHERMKTNDIYNQTHHCKNTLGLLESVQHILVALQSLAIINSSIYHTDIKSKPFPLHSQYQTQNVF